VIFVGGTGPAKLTCASASPRPPFAPRLPFHALRARNLWQSRPREGALLQSGRSRQQLEQEKAAGRTGRLAEKLLRYDYIAIDELGYLPFS
jgi:hypothetical protein